LLQTLSEGAGTVIKGSAHGRFDQGFGTTCGDGDPGPTSGASNLTWCARL
jgi:hypothetical protein